MSQPPHSYRPTSRIVGSIGPSNSLNQSDNVTVGATETLLLPAGTSTDEVRIVLLTMGANTTKVVIGPLGVDVAKGADILFSVRDTWIQAINNEFEPIYVVCDHADGATLGVSYSRAF